jgi:AMP phosphorylase
MRQEEMEYRDGTRKPSGQGPPGEIETGKAGNTFRVRLINMDAGENTVVMHRDDARLWGLHSQDRIKVARGGRSVTAIIHTTKDPEMLEPGELGALRRVRKAMELSDGDEVKVFLTGRPESVAFIKKKLRGEELSLDEIRAIIRDMVNHNLSDIEATAYVTGIYTRGLTMEETRDLTLAMVETGETIEFDRGPIFDYHSIGGSPGNKVTLLVVPLVAAAGLLIPKTCSRAISSANGTADILESICNVTFTGEQIKEISQRVGGIIAWGGGVNLAPADDLIIKIEYPLALDPYNQLLASVMAKKKAVGANYLLIDIPMGPGTKVETEELARRYANDFIHLGKLLDIKVEAVVTYGGQPVGHAIGPALETREALQILEGSETPNSVLEKSCGLAGIIFEMAGLTDDGFAMARELLSSGKALAKFREIIEAQGGKPNISSADVPIGEYYQPIRAPSDGYVDAIDNKAIVRIAREAGAPNDKGAGVLLNKKTGRKAQKDDVLYTVYSSNERRLQRAVELSNSLKPIHLEGMLLERIGALKRL